LGAQQERVFGRRARSLTTDLGNRSSPKGTVIAHGRFLGHGCPAAWIAADIVRFEDGKLTENRDVLQDEATQAESVRGLPMFGEPFPG
jgi:hypothetical protein